MMFGVEVLRLPFNSDAFWDLPRDLFASARIWYEDTVEAELEALDKIDSKQKK